MHEKIARIIVLWVCGLVWVSGTIAFAHIASDGVKAVQYACLLWMGLLFPILFGLVFACIPQQWLRVSTSIDGKFFAVGMSIAIHATAWALWPPLVLQLLAAMCMGVLFTFHVPRGRLPDFAFTGFAVMLGVTFLIHSL